MQRDTKTYVIGGGLIGLAAAVQLAHSGRTVCVLDAAKSTPAASWGNAGHIATEQVDTLASWDTIKTVPRRLFSRGGAVAFPVSDIAVWAPWAWRYLRASGAAQAARGKEALASLAGHALAAWHRLAETLGDPALVIEQGHLLVWESAESADLGAETWARTDIGTAEMRALGAEQLLAVNARIKCPHVGGLQFKKTAQIARPATALQQLAAALRARGGTILEATVKSLEVHVGRVAIVLESGALIEPESVLVAAGIGSRPLLASIGYTVPLIAERGYHLEANVGRWGLPPVVFEDRSVAVTQFGDRLRATSFVEFARPESPADPRKWQRLRQHVRELGLPFEGPISEWMGARPTLPDYLPAIGASNRHDNLYYAFGHQHLGLTLSAITGELVAAIMNGKKPAVAMHPFDVERFR